MALGKDGMDGCGTFMKYALFFANFAILIGGITIVSIGIWTLVAKAFVAELLGTNLFLGAVYIFIASGIIISLVAFFGCMGAVKEIKCMLLMYFIVVFILFVTLLVGGILGYVFKDKVQYTMKQKMVSSMRDYNDSHRQYVKYAWDQTQATLECCGVDGIKDWEHYGPTPQSCCIFNKQTNQRLMCESIPDQYHAYQRGCLEVTTVFVQSHATVIGGAGIGVACLMLLGMIFSCSLFMAIQ